MASAGTQDTVSFVLRNIASAAPAFDVNTAATSVRSPILVPSQLVSDLVSPKYEYDLLRPYLRTAGRCCTWRWTRRTSCVCSLELNFNLEIPD